MPPGRRFVRNAATVERQWHLDAGSAFFWLVAQRHHGRLSRSRQASQVLHLQRPPRSLQGHGHRVLGHDCMWPRACACRGLNANSLSRSASAFIADSQALLRLGSARGGTDASAQAPAAAQRLLHLRHQRADRNRLPLQGHRGRAGAQEVAVGGRRRRAVLDLLHRHQEPVAGLLEVPQVRRRLGAVHEPQLVQRVAPRRARDHSYADDIRGWQHSAATVPPHDRHADAGLWPGQVRSIAAPTVARVQTRFTPRSRVHTYTDTNQCAMAGERSSSSSKRSTIAM